MLLLLPHLISPLLVRVRQEQLVKSRHITKCMTGVIQLMMRSSWPVPQLWGVFSESSNGLDALLGVATNDLGPKRLGLVDLGLFPNDDPKYTRSGHHFCPVENRNSR